MIESTRKTSAAAERLHVSDTEMVLQALRKLSAPLTSVRMSLDLALDPALADHSRHMLRQGLREAERAVRLPHLLRETLEASIPQGDADVVNLLGAVKSVLVNMPERERFREDLRGNVPVLAAWKPLRVSLSCFLTACLKYAKPEGTIELDVDFDIENVILGAEFQQRDGAEPTFHLFSDDDGTGSLALARALAQGCGGHLEIRNGGSSCCMFLRLPMALIDILEVQ